MSPIIFHTIKEHTTTSRRYQTTGEIKIGPCGPIL
jgi:hypothetical protein